MSDRHLDIASALARLFHQNDNRRHSVGGAVFARQTLTSRLSRNGFSILNCYAKHGFEAVVLVLIPAATATFQATPLGIRFNVTKGPLDDRKIPAQMLLQAASAKCDPFYPASSMSGNRARDIQRGGIGITAGRCATGFERGVNA